MPVLWIGDVECILGARSGQLSIIKAISILWPAGRVRGGAAKAFAGSAFISHFLWSGATIESHSDFVQFL